MSTYSMKSGVNSWTHKYAQIVAPATGFLNPELCIKLMQENKPDEHFCPSYLLRGVEQVILPSSVVQLLSSSDTPEGFSQVKIVFPIESKVCMYVSNQCLNALTFDYKSSNQPLQAKSIESTFLMNQLGKLYIWGGNCVEPIEQGLKVQLSEDAFYNQYMTFQGFDCSGLVYALFQGRIPRNTSEMIEDNQYLEIVSLGLDSLRDNLLPYDLILYKGHVLIVGPKGQYIYESIHQQKAGGVKRFVKESLQEVLSKRGKTVYATSSEKVNTDKRCFFVKRYRWYLK